jgi:hypothetical protein
MRGKGFLCPRGNCRMGEITIEAFKVKEIFMDLSPFSQEVKFNSSIENSPLFSI